MATDLLGDTTCPWGEMDCNPCIDDVEENFANISASGSSGLRIEASDDDGEVMSDDTNDHELTESPDFDTRTSVVARKLITGVGWVSYFAKT